jgi:polysaccharide biosynthesis protein PelF
MLSRHLRALLATEGTYPFTSGGVSTWCHQLCEQLQDVDFTLLAVTGQPQSAWCYQRPARVGAAVQVPLWPGEEPAIYLHRGSYAEVMVRRRRTTQRRIELDFVPPLCTFVREVLIGGVPIEELLDAIVRLGLYFRDYDYKATMRNEATWRVVREVAEERSNLEVASGSPAATAGDLTLCARWLYHLMLPIALRVEDVTVFHASIAASCALPGIVARLTDGTSFLLTEHGVYLRERHLAIGTAAAHSHIQKCFLVGFARALARAVYAAADRIAPVTTFNTRWELRWGADAQRVQVIHNGVDTDAFRPRPQRDSGVRPTAVIAARVFPLKDIETLIRAVHVLGREMPTALVAVYGALDADPPYVARCRALAAELGVEGRIELRGPHARPTEMYHEGDISVLSSISEGFPYTIIESMACGVPCVATDVGGVREAIADTGLVVPPRDPEALAQAMRALLANPALRRELGERASARARAHFTIEGQIKAYAQLYDELHALTLDRRARRAS